MKKIDLKKTMDEQVRDTEWTDENTWNVLRKIRNTKSARGEFNLRRLMPAAAALLLVLGIGITVMVRQPGTPDTFRNDDGYTVQPLVTALAAGQEEGEGEAGKAIREEMNIHYPEIADQLRPINLSCEKDGIRLELISGAVKGDECWIVYSLQDLEGRYPGKMINGAPILSSTMGEFNYGDGPILYTDEKEHKYYYCYHEVYEQPVDPADRIVSLYMNSYEVAREVKLDLVELLKEHGTTDEGVLSPELAPGFTAEGEVSRSKKNVLDYTKPLDIPVLDDVKLTGVGWIDGSAHIQFHNLNAHPIGSEKSQASGNWGISMDYDPDFWTENLYDSACWDENGDGATDWDETILNCTPEYLEKMRPTVVVTVTDEIVDGSWEISFPLRVICADTVDQIDAGTELQQRNPEVAEGLYEFFKGWAGGDCGVMRTASSTAWMSGVYDLDGFMRSLIASGRPLNYQINSISGQNGDEERTAVCTVEMAMPAGEEPMRWQYEIPVRKEEWGYRVDPAGLCTREAGVFDPAMGKISLSTDSILRNELTYLDAAPFLKPVQLSSEKQGIVLNVVSAAVRGQQAWYICTLTDKQNNNLEPFAPVFTDDIGTIVNSQPVSMYSDTAEHMSTWRVEVKYDQPVNPEDRTVTLKMDSVNVYEGAQADLTPVLKQYAKAAEGVEPPQIAWSILRNRRWGPTRAENLKVLDYSRSLEVPLFGNVELSNIGWIDGKLHIQVHADSQNAGSFPNLWLNAFLRGNTDTLWKELDYSPVEWYEDNDSWCEYVYDYSPEDLDRLEITADAVFGAKTVTDDWSVQLPLTAIYSEDKPAEDNTADIDDEWRGLSLSSRMTEFMACWSGNDPEGMLALCTEPWRNEPDLLKDILQDRTPESWELSGIIGIELPVAVVECDICTQPDGIEKHFHIKAKMEADGLWYFEPSGLRPGDTKEVELLNMKDEDIILTGDAAGSITKGEDVPEFAGRLAEFFACWNKQDQEAMRALCLPSEKTEENVNLMHYLVVGFGRPIEWKMGRIYGMPEDENKGVACAVRVRLGNYDAVWYPFDIVMTRGTDGLWYVNGKSLNIAAYVITDPIELQNVSSPET